MATVNFESVAHKLGLSEQAINVIRNIRERPPARNVGSSGKNVSGFYPSVKMGMTIQFESHTLELAAIYLKEHNSHVIEYYDQPPSFPIRFIILDKNNKEKNHGQMYTADFFTIEENWIGWEEWKYEKDLIKLAIEYPNRYVLDDEGVWRCPPAEEYANQLGLSFRVRTDREIDRIYQRNMIFLEDYLLHKPPVVDRKDYDQLTTVVRENPGITLKEILASIQIDADCVYTALIHELIYIDLYKEPLAEVDRVGVFIDSGVAESYANMVSVKKNDDSNVPFVEVEIGSHFQWDGRKFVFVNIGETKYSLLREDEELVVLPINIFNSLVREGHIRGLSVKENSNEQVGLEIIKAASEGQLLEANKRFQHVMTFLNNGEIPSEVPSRTLRDWLLKFRKAETQLGNGFLGLLPHRDTQGNRKRRYQDEVITLVEGHIENYYESAVQRNKTAVYKLLVAACKEKGYTVPSFRTFCTMIESRSIHEQTRKRKGVKAAYSTEPIYMELSLNTPRHGDRPFEICHIDHTELDIELVCSQTGKNLERPWATFLVDSYSRRILVVYVTFDPPSYRTCMMVLRECVKRHSRLPQMLVVDGGKEFQSIYFDTLLANYKIVKKERPGAKPRFGSVCERLFGTANTTFIHNLLGNTQITKNVRQVTKEVNPKKRAVWTLGSFYTRLQEWAYEVYDTALHPAHGISPRDAYLQSIAITGHRKFSMVSYDETFKMLTLPTTRKGNAKVEPGKGVKINKYYYWSERLNRPDVEGQQVPVRYDPFNMGIAYAYVSKQWVPLHSAYYSIFANKTEKEIKLATEELKRRLKINGKKQIEITAAKLAQFLKSVEAEEVLQKQRLRDMEFRKVFKVVDGEKSVAESKDPTPSVSKNNLVVINTGKNNSRSIPKTFEMLEEF